MAGAWLGGHELCEVWLPLYSTGVELGMLELPVRVLCAHVHLEENPLCESLKALPAFPKVPVTELRVQLAGGSGARQDTLILHADLAEAWLKGSGLVQK